MTIRSRGGQVAAGVSFAVLGPLQVLRDGRPVPVTGRRLRALLALLLDAGRTVAAERLIEGVWADRRPQAPANALQALVSRLRGALAGGRDLVVAEYGGYRPAIAPGQVDLHRFTALVAEGRERPVAAGGRGFRRPGGRPSRTAGPGPLGTGGAPGRRGGRGAGAPRTVECGP